ncbi:MAG: preprotein translocase subunit SecG [Proteobacteria bacterium]|jgi:preprotein translocase subunit SecG|nr:preprotein translocase subunit SecG [Pseudomonadota bacterium]MDA1291001.1 preprotein translocase subunit SecG [Pseudomonadota bacterium]
METIVVVVHVIVAIGIVGLVLLQQGKGADAGASFGAGSSQTVFGASGTGNFLVRATTVGATIFFITSLSLAVFAKNQSSLGGAANSPLANEALLQEAASPIVSDVPQLDAAPLPSSDEEDVPSLPGSDN